MRTASSFVIAIIPHSSVDRRLWPKQKTPADAAPTLNIMHPRAPCWPRTHSASSQAGRLRSPRQSLKNSYPAKWS
jgi:hypothetical protein